MAFKLMYLVFIAAVSAPWIVVGSVTGAVGCDSEGAMDRPNCPSNPTPAGFWHCDRTYTQCTAAQGPAAKKLCDVGGWVKTTGPWAGNKDACDFDRVPACESHGGDAFDTCDPQPPVQLTAIAPVD